MPGESATSSSVKAKKVSGTGAPSMSVLGWRSSSKNSWRQSCVDMNHSISRDLLSIPRNDAMTHLDGLGSP